MTKFIPATKRKEQYLYDFDNRNLDLTLVDSAGTEAPRRSHTKAMCEAGAGVVGDRGRSERVQSPGGGGPWSSSRRLWPRAGISSEPALGCQRGGRWLMHSEKGWPGLPAS